jgi:hypothetical protein
MPKINPDAMQRFSVVIYLHLNLLASDSFSSLYSYPPYGIHLALNVMVYYYAYCKVYFKI